MYFYYVAPYLILQCLFSHCSLCLFLVTLIYHYVKAINKWWWSTWRWVSETLNLFSNQSAFFISASPKQFLHVRTPLKYLQRVMTKQNLCVPNYFENQPWYKSKRTFSFSSSSEKFLPSSKHTRSTFRTDKNVYLYYRIRPNPTDQSWNTICPRGGGKKNKAWSPLFHFRGPWPN